MNIPKSIKIELLPRYKTRTGRTPTFWEYIREWGQRRPMWNLEGAYFFQGSGRGFKTAVQLLQASNTEITVKNLDEVFAQFYISDFSDCNFVIAPDGQVFVCQPQGGWFYRTSFIHNGRPAVRYLSDRHTASIDKLRHPSWGPTQVMLELLTERLFPVAYRAARKEWIAEAKASGAWAVDVQRAKSLRLVTKTKRTMKVCMQAKQAVEEIEQYIKDINDGKATQKQVGQLYNTLIELTSLNKKLKTSLPKE